MSILKNLQKAHAAVVVDAVKGATPGALGKAFSNAAVNAITKGLGSDEWRAYMAIFADNAAQLERLTVQKPPGEEDDYLPLLRAYVVSNSVCDIGTNTNTVNRVDARIDKGLTDEAADGVPNQYRPASIPKIPDV
jgi:hypothetical protein